MRVKILKDIYETFHKIRNLEFEISRRYSEQKMRCPTHLSIGQELVSSVFAQIVKKNDYAISSHRGHAHYIAKGGNLKKMISEIYGKETGCSKGRGGSMHIIDLNVNFMGTSAIVGNSIPIGAGLALSNQIKNNNNISFVFFGDGATEEGVFYETINFSIIKKLPIIFVCENNLYSVYSPLSVRQPKNRIIHKMTSALGINSKGCDGNNHIEVFKNFNNAVKYVKKNKKPFFLEFYNYRWLEHCGPNYDNNIGYRTQKEFLKWKKKDAFDKIRKLLINKIGEKKITEIEKKNIRQINEAFVFAEKSKFPRLKPTTKDIYAKS